MMTPRRGKLVWDQQKASEYCEKKCIAILDGVSHLICLLCLKVFLSAIDEMRRKSCETKSVFTLSVSEMRERPP